MGSHAALALTPNCRRKGNREELATADAGAGAGANVGYMRTTMIPHSIGVGVIVVLVEAVVLLSGVSQLGGLGGSELNVTKVQVGVQQILADPAGGYGANAVTEVSCNNGRNPSATKGTVFTCAVTVNGVKRQVAVLVSDDAGRYEVDRPR